MMFLLYYHWSIALWKVFVKDVYQLCSILNCLVRVEKTVPSMFDQNDFHTETIIML